MTILSIEFSPLFLTVAGGFAWLGLCVFLAWLLCRPGGPYDRPDHDEEQAKADELFAPIRSYSRQEMMAALKARAK